jgi:hypothetical protein
VEVTSDPIPDPLLHATRISTRLPETPDSPDIVLLDNELAEEAVNSAKSILCSSDKCEEEGSTKVSSVTVPRRVMPNAGGADAGSKELVPCGVTWKRVGKWSVTQAENGEKREGISASDAAFSHVAVGALANGKCEKITGLRIVLAMGKHASNERSAIGFAAVSFHEPDPSTWFVPASKVLATVQDWLHTTASANKVARFAALSASLRLAQASGSLEMFARYFLRVLREDEAAAISDASYTSLVSSVVANLDAAVKPAYSKFSALCAARNTRAIGGEVPLLFDPSASGSCAGDSSGILTFSNGNKTAKTTSGSNCLAIADTSFSSGKVMWEMTFDDSESDECTCFGAVRYAELSPFHECSSFHSVL